MEKAIEREIIKAIRWETAYRPIKPLHQQIAKRAAAAIAKLCNEEIAEKEQQLAKMRGALAKSDDLVNATYDSGYYAGRGYGRGQPVRREYEELSKVAIEKRNLLHEAMRKALSATPKED